MSRESRREPYEESNLQRGPRTWAGSRACPSVQMRQNHGQHKHDRNPLGCKEGVARLLQKQAGILRRHVACVPNDELSDQEAPDQPDHASGYASKPDPTAVQAHGPPPIVDLKREIGNDGGSVPLKLA